MTDPDQLLTAKDVSALTGIKGTTLQGWRFRHQGPPWFKVVGRVVYRESALRAWIAEQEDAATARRSA